MQDTPESRGSELGSAAADVQGVEEPGAWIDRYKLLEKIGEGGMGSVWMAEQREPVVRRVALKIIKLGMDTREVVVRFEAERQALAMMDHPNIAKVLDGGATSTGRPYFVMGLVKGTPITSYCDAAGADLRERLGLFIQVCDAVQHAHLRGIIHRDIKPENVLVTLHDGVPVPKVIDFGIAKATHAELTQKTMFTQHAQILGTPEYMAPEQAELRGLDIDTRADVYSLGVLLYELLTGTRPFDLRTLLEKGFDEILRTIREVDPERPSTRVSTASADASPVAVGRQVDVESLSKRLRGDLDWVIMKALEKDRRHRYESASGFAEDVQRYLRDEPVTAAPPGNLYRIGKFVRRRKGAVAAASTILLLLIGGTVGTGIGWWNTRQANRALSDALDAQAAALVEEERQRELAEENAQLAREAERTAAERAEELQQVVDFQSVQLSGFRVEEMGVRMKLALVEAIPDADFEALYEQFAVVNFTSLALRTLEENLFDRSIEAIEAQFADQPLVRARLLETVGSNFRTLGLPEAAGEPLKEALEIRRSEFGEEHPESAKALYQVGRQQLEAGLFDEAEASLRGAVEVQRRVLGVEHVDTLDSLTQLGSTLRALGRIDEAESIYFEALEGKRRVYGDRDLKTAIAAENLAVLFAGMGRLEEAERYYREALDVSERQLGEEHPMVHGTYGSLGGVLVRRGEYALAEPYLERALAAKRRARGDAHPETLSALNSFAFLRHKMGRVDEAEALYREAVELRRRVLGPEHPRTLSSINNLAVLLQEGGRTEEATGLSVEILEARERLLGPDHPETIVSLTNVGAAYIKLGDRERTEFYWQAALERSRRTLGPEHPSTLKAVDDIGYLRELQGRMDEAEALYRESLAGRRRVLGDTSPRTLLSMTNLAFALDARGDLEGAEPLFLEAFAGRRSTFGPEHEKTLSSAHYLGALYAAQGRYELAEDYLRESYEGRRRVLGDEHSKTVQSREAWSGALDAAVDAARAGGEAALLGRTLLRAGVQRRGIGQPEAAEALLREAATYLAGDESLGLLANEARSHLGAALAELGRTGEAAALLEESAAWALSRPRSEDESAESARALVERALEFAERGVGSTSADEWRRRLEAWARGSGD